MALPSQEVIQDVRALIGEITGFKENEENFTACEQYCLSHVIHHSFPSVNKTTVRKAMEEYSSRFHGHGYFRVAEALNCQVKAFLSNEELFQCNPEYDIQWTLLSLLDSLSSNLTSVSKVPELLSTCDEEDKAVDDVNWPEYLKQGLPQINDFAEDSDDGGSDSNDSDTSQLMTNVNRTKNGFVKKNLRMDDVEDYDDEDVVVVEDEDDDDDDDDEDNNKDDNFNDDKYGDKEGSVSFLNDINVENKNDISGDNLIETVVPPQAIDSSVSNFSTKHNYLEEYIKNQIVRVSVHEDRIIRGNVAETYDAFMSSKGVHMDSDILSEIEVIEYVLYQFQTGHNIFLSKGITSPSLCSITQATLQNFLSSLEPYFEIIKSFKEFNVEVETSIYSTTTQKHIEINGRGSVNDIRRESMSNSSSKTHFFKEDRSNKTVPKVIKAYNSALKRSLEPFEEKILKIEINRIYYTLVSMEKELRPYFKDLTYLFRVHHLITSKWKEEPNWKCAVRTLCVLYNAIMDTPSRKLSFQFLDMFLECFQVYLDIIDSWISCLDLEDPHNEFVVHKVKITDNPENLYCKVLLHPYKEVLSDLDVQQFELFDVIAEKMYQVGQSLEVLSRLDQFLDPYHTPWDNLTSIETLHQCLVRKIKNDVNWFLKISNSPVEIFPHSKDKSIFTLKNVVKHSLPGDGGGDVDSVNINKRNRNCISNGTKIKEFKGEKDQELDAKACEEKSGFGKNPFFEMTFKGLSMKDDQDCTKNLKFKFVTSNESFSKLCSSKSRETVLPLHKIIKIHFTRIITDRVSVVCTLVKDVILGEFKLNRHLALLRSVMLYNDAYLLLPFSALFFNQSSTWQNSYSLTLHLRECVEASYKELAHDLSVVIEDNHNSMPSNVLEAIDGISVSFKVKWPLNLIIDSDAMKKYNDIFKMILKLKWATSALCGLYFQKGNEPLPGILRSTFHRLQLLRHWCLSDLGRISNYFMTEVSRNLDSALDNCKHLKDIINVHTKFIEKLHYRCLLHSDLEEGRELIFCSIIPLCKDLQKCWLKETVIANSRLNLMEAMYRSNHIQLNRLLASLEKD